MTANPVTADADGNLAFDAEDLVDFYKYWKTMQDEGLAQEVVQDTFVDLIDKASTRSPLIRVSTRTNGPA